MTERDKRLLILLCLSSVFLLNDFLFIRSRSWASWLAIDYGSRIAAVGAIVWLVATGRATRQEFGFKAISFRDGLFWAVVLTVNGILIDQVLWRFFERILPDTRLASMPRIADPLVNILDLTFGVALVALSEELVFRGYCYTALRDRLRPGLLLFVSAVLFGLIHWSTGLHAIVTTAIWGVLPMLSLARTGSIIPAVIAHYLTDLVSLGGFIPANWLSP